MEQTYRLVLAGFGNVGRALARLLMKKEAELSQKFGIRFIVTGISTGTYAKAIDPQGIDLRTALSLVENKKSLYELNKVAFEGDTTAFIRNCPGDVFFETTPVNMSTGNPAIEHLIAALESGMHAITANKGPVVYAYKKLVSLAKQQGKRFLFESTVMDGAPVFGLFRQPLKGAKLLGFTGIINSCTNLLLDLMADGKTLDQAIEVAASIGITEADPSNDVDGWDASIKVAALCTVLMEKPMTPHMVDRTGIRGITPDMIKEAAAAGEKYKLICSAGTEDGHFFAKVSPQRVGVRSPFYNVNKTDSFILLNLDVLPALGLLESNTTPETTAYGLLADCLNAITENAHL